MQKPSKLQSGDKVAAISLSWGGPGTIPGRYAAGKKQLEDEFGLQVVETRHALRDETWLKRNPQARAADLMEAFADPSIKAVISTIGGDDSIRILPYLDLDVLRAHPKIFMGFSDTTITHLACYRAGLVSFYGPSIMAGFGENGGLFPYLVDAVRRTLFSAAAPGEIRPNRDGWTVEHLDWADPANQSRPRRLNPPVDWKFLQGQGIRRGRLLGGCIEVFDWLRGTPWWPAPEAFQDAILFLETSEDAPPPAVVEQILRVYASLGILKKLSGMLFGRPGGGVPVEQFAEYEQAILQVVRDEEGLDDLPVVTRMEFGHTDPVCVLPYGVLAEIDCPAWRFSILEAGVV
jgi:muramoyltetrapeptide carboxypeptidase LdcA involved in peptidoglycan recycling